MIMAEIALPLTAAGVYIKVSNLVSTDPSSIRCALSCQEYHFDLTDPGYACVLGP